ncbi:TetR family transcriptional regulator [Stenotrophomonas sp. PS02298]|uniref:TetR/AcrR family transcriptional regulator n=1 Tax=Stenotrophomonas sp. PS02298 TaxID=2991424 RepID=UPI00249A3151|nr:TetR family transcriptional regulator [Stenotrophomonas sp. PS02298]
MKVTKAQSQANRAHVVETASTLFRQFGYQGIGVADLMAAAGLTQGGFYKHFASKADLAAESATCGFQQTARLQTGDASAFIKQYLSRAHRDNPSQGCTMAALATDASRQPEQVRTAFAEGLEQLLGAGHQAAGQVPADAPSMSQQERARRIEAFSQLVGALVLSRACPDDAPLADEILNTCRDRALARLKPRN